MKKTNEELIKIYKETNDVSVRNEIVENNMGLAHSVANKYKGRGQEYDDLFQECCVSLILAVDKYDLSKGVKFNTYAYHVMTGDLKKYFRENNYIMKLPQKYLQLMNEIYHIEGYLTQELQRTIDEQDLADYFNVDVLDIYEVKSIMHMKSANYSNLTDLENDIIRKL